MVAAHHRMPYLDNPDPQLAPMEARLQLAAIVDSSDDAIISKDLNGIITSWNAAATRVFGYDPYEIIGRSVLTIIPENLHWQEPEILRKIAAGERIEHFETVRKRKNGELIHISLTISPIRDNSGKIIGISKIARDITERKLAEAALFESERMAAIGRMAASIAHEVNNPLEAILNLSYLLLQNDSLNNEARSYANLLLDEVLRVSEITKQTLSFYRDTSTASEVDVGELIETVVRLQQSMLERKNIKVSHKHQRQSCIWARPGELRQIFINLIINAIDALPVGGRIRTSVTRSDRTGMVHITVADNGPGIADAIQERIFEPFFSTKMGKGTGLGLWVTQGIVRKYGGTIRMRTCSTRPGKNGTMFRITLPAQP